MELTFKLTNESKVNLWGVKLYRIEAIVDIPGKAKKGEKGGWVESEEVNGDARVSGDAWVYGDAQVYGNAWVYGDAQVYGDARVYGDAEVYGNARVYGDAEVYGDARVYGDAQVYGNAWVYGDAQVYGKLSLTSGWFFGMCYNKEETKYVQVDGDSELICKGDIKYEIR